MDIIDRRRKALYVVYGIMYLISATNSGRFALGVMFITFLVLLFNCFYFINRKRKLESIVFILWTALALATFLYNLIVNIS